MVLFEIPNNDADFLHTVLTVHIDSCIIDYILSIASFYLYNDC